MKREKLVIYDSCDFCDSMMAAVGHCDICGKHYCHEHGRSYPYGDQMYAFCNEHQELVNAIINITGIPIGFVMRKLLDEEFSEYMINAWNERGYGTRWNDYVGQNK